MSSCQHGPHGLRRRCTLGAQLKQALLAKCVAALDPPLSNLVQRHPKSFPLLVAGLDQVATGYGASRHIPPVQGSGTGALSPVPQQLDRTLLIRGLSPDAARFCKGQILHWVSGRENVLQLCHLTLVQSPPQAEGVELLSAHQQRREPGDRIGSHIDDTFKLAHFSLGHMTKLNLCADAVEGHGSYLVCRGGRVSQNLEHLRSDSLARDLVQPLGSPLDRRGARGIVNIVSGDPPVKAVVPQDSEVIFFQSLTRLPHEQRSVLLQVTPSTEVVI
mmetsp:Transcript_7165/g.18375  ORF Transcript_7165/g.18375 Transcript_7165/m.18375 type:complete len:274 (+) Transcript_7165:66-887(+)